MAVRYVGPEMNLGKLRDAGSFTAREKLNGSREVAPAASEEKEGS